MRPIGLRPMQAGELLSASLDLFGRNPLIYLGISLIATLPSMALGVVMTLLIPANAPTQAPSPELILMALLAALPLILVIALTQPLCQGAIIHCVAAAYLGRQLTITEAYRRALPRLLPLLIANFLGGIITVFGLMFCILPGLLFMIWLILVMPVVMLEGSGPFAALERSRDLVQTDIWHVVTLLIYLFIVLMVVGVGSSMAIGLMKLPPLVTQVGSDLLGALLMPLYTAALSLLYFDLRLRRGEIDEEWLRHWWGRA